MARQAESNSPFTAAELNERAARRRAIEALVWGMAAVNYDLMLQAALRIGGAYNQIVYWSRLPSWKNQTLTPNPDSIYLMLFMNTKDVGPVVLEIPPADDGSITGSIDDCWQTALEDVGPAGADKGDGGKYLILPPGYQGDVPSGHIALPSDTFQSYALLRSILRDGSDAAIAKAVAYGKRVKLYPLSDAAERPNAVFVDAIEEMFDATIPYDVRFYQALDRIVQAEPWLMRDKAMIDQLRSVGIEKGKRFEPDETAQRLLQESADEAHAWIDLRYEALFAAPYYEGTHWALPADSEVVEGLETNFAQPDSYPIDGRGTSYSMAFFSAKRLGAGQFYLMSIKDAEGNAFDGAHAYRLTVPAKAPITQYWSATVYDRVTHALIRDTRWSSRSSQSPGLKQSPDGSVNVYYAPEAPSGQEANWIPTSREGRFEVLFRLYGPEKSFFDKTWKLPDIEAVR
ncbi:MAG: DUF1254 domain-containing protein [Candidatus Cybelea sp.]